MMRSAWLSVVLVAVCATSARADDQDQQVLALMKKALAAESAGHLSEAEALDKQAFDMKPTFDVATNLGIVEVEQGEWRAGCQHLSYATARFPVVLKKDIRENAMKRLAEASEHVARVHLNVAAAGATVTLDGTALGTSPITDVVCLDPGHHEFRSTRDGYEDASLPFEAGHGGPPVELTIELRGKNGDGGPKPPIQHPPPPTKPIWPYAVTGAAAAVGLGVGVGFLVWGETASSAAADKVKQGLCHSVAAMQRRSRVSVPRQPTQHRGGRWGGRPRGRRGGARGSHRLRRRAGPEVERGRARAPLPSSPQERPASRFATASSLLRQRSSCASFSLASWSRHRPCAGASASSAISPSVRTAPVARPRRRRPPPQRRLPRRARPRRRPHATHRRSRPEW